jgi:hypothetical protein
MQVWRSTSTMPSARLNEAPVGQTSTQGGSAQCWHITGSRSLGLAGANFLDLDLADPLGICPLGGVPPDSPFSVPQAVTQSVQPVVHFVVSISMPQRTVMA